MKDEKPKSRSLKIRHILYRIWQNTDRKMTEEEYYQMRTSVIISELMKELDDAPIPE